MTPEPTVTTEPFVKLGVKIPKTINQQLNVEAARREMKKQELVAQILSAYFATADDA